MRFQAVVEVVLAYSLIRFDISPLFFSSRPIGRTLGLLNFLIGSSYYDFDLYIGIHYYG